MSSTNEWNISQHEKRNFISPSDHVMFYLFFQHQWNTNPFHFWCQRCHLLGNHNNGDRLTCENNMFNIFTCDGTMFSRESSAGVSLVFYKIKGFLLLLLLLPLLLPQYYFEKSLPTSLFTIYSLTVTGQFCKQRFSCTIPTLTREVNTELFLTFNRKTFQK